MSINDQLTPNIYLHKLIVQHIIVIIYRLSDWAGEAGTRHDSIKQLIIVQVKFVMCFAEYKHKYFILLVRILSVFIMKQET